MIYFVNYLKKLIEDIINEIIIIPFALVYLYCISKDKNKMNVIICEHIGDIIFTLGYLDAYKKEYRIKYINVFCSKNMENLAGLYSNSYDEYKHLSKLWEKVIMCSYNYTLGQSVISKLKNVIIINPGSDYTMGYNYAMKFSENNLKKCICKGSLGIEQEDNFKLPYLIEESSNVKRIITELNLQHNMSILLCPYASVTKEIDLKLFELLANYYSKKKYVIVTNIAPKQKPIKGTTALSLSLNETFEIGKYFDVIIGLRSGILDLLSFTNKMIIALYPMENNFATFYNLSYTYKINKKIYQYIVTNDLKKDLSNIILLTNGIYKE